MIIDWNNFTPANAVAGGMLIGLSAALLALAMGRIAGISGILGGLLHRREPADFHWRAAFVAGLLAAPLLLRALGLLPESVIDSDWITLVVAGLLVGFGSRLGSGCTSGHGVCGLSRLSPRSFAATLTFMTVGFLTVFAVRHLIA